MRSIFLSLAALTLIAGPAAGAGAQTTKARAMATTSAVPVAQLVNRVDIPYQRFTLPNGLRVLVHEDRKAPIVAVSVWYNVGSKDEPKGKTGFAHLFEHLMFKATRNLVPEQVDRLTEDVGGYNNASTGDDYTNYFEVVPANHLQRLLFAEADRMARAFLAAGFAWREPGCSLCVAANGETVPPGARSVSTSNRNFVGRQGTGARTHLASPAMAAAAALAGAITDPRRA